jgi:hypothetical protein
MAIIFISQSFRCLFCVVSEIGYCGHTYVFINCGHTYVFINCGHTYVFINCEHTYVFINCGHTYVFINWGNNSLIPGYNIYI